MSHPKKQPGRKPGAHFECDFIHDPRAFALSPVAWTLYSKLWIQAVEERREVLCRMKFSDRWIAGHFNIARNSLRQAFQNCATHGLILIHQHFIQVVGVQKKHPLLTWYDSLSCCKEAGAYIKSTPEPEPEPEPSPEPDNPLTPQEGDEPVPKKRKRRAATAHPDELRFDEFWDSYPKKLEEDQTRRNWKARLREGVPADDMIRAAKHYAKHRNGKDPNFTTKPSNFIGQKAQWKDFVNGTPVELMDEVERAWYEDEKAACAAGRAYVAAHPDEYPPDPSDPPEIQKLRDAMKQEAAP